MRIGPLLALVSLASVHHRGEAKPAADAPEEAPARSAPGREATPVEPASAEPPRPSPSRRALSTAAAVVPGAVVHGSGHLVAGDPQTGYTLLAAEGVGLGLVLGGGTTFLLSGASRYLVAPAAALTILGFGLFGFSLAADIYGTASADGGAVELVPRLAPSFESELGYRYVADPRFAYDHFVVESVTWRGGHYRVTPSAWFATGGENARYRVEGAYRLIGVLPGERATTSDQLDIVLGALHHRYSPEHFQRSGIELALSSRYDLAHVGPSLRGAFVEFGVGYGLARIDYDLRGSDVPADGDDILLANLGFGALLRGKAAPGSEIRFYYDHRHDDFAAGLLMTGLLSGVPGKFGLDGRWFFSPRVGVLADVHAGSAVVSGLSLVLREGIAPRPGAPR
ncbi:MAG TPA: hypothetical protein VGK73_02385 [Polyangiaceae bacterium]